MDPKFVAGVIYFSTRRKSPVAGPSGEPCVYNSTKQALSMKRGYSHILAIRVCAAGEGMVFKPFGLVKGMVFKPFAVVKGMVFKPFGLVKGRTFANPAAPPTQTIWEYPPPPQAMKSL